MTKFLRFAGVTLLALTIGGGCGDDDPVTPVAPPAPAAPTPPPPAVAVTMSPASQTIGVGGTVVFAVSVSGGVAGEAASWTCASSDPSMATVTMTPAGCAATAVAAGGVTITAVVTKGGATVNTAAGLTITEDMAERALMFIASISDSDTDEDDDVLSDRVSVELSVELGDQMLTQLSVLVDGVVAVSRSYGGGASVVAAAPEGEEGERAAQQAVHPFVLSFNSADYDALTGVPTYMNGERTISAKLMVASSDEPLESGGHPREFGNGDAVHVTVSGLGEGVMHSTTGQRWYGGPKAALEMTALPVLYSGGSAASVSVTLLAFCGADAATETSETSVTFTPECSATSNAAATEIAGVVTEPAGDSPRFVIANAEVDILGDDVFPLYLDYEGPDAPYFKPNPNGRDAGWVNPTVDFLGEYKEDKNDDGWLVYNKDKKGVGGYAPQLRFSSTTPEIVDGALEATANALPTEPTKIDAACVIATAVDLLDNESKLPSAGKTCATAAKYIMDDSGDYPAGLRAGLDVLAPTIKFSSISPEADSRKVSDYQFQIADETDGSGFSDAPVVARIEIRNAKNEIVCGDGSDTDMDLPGDENVRGECENNSYGLSHDQGLKLVTTSGLGSPSLGYHMITAVARDKAGNDSEPRSRVSLHDASEAVSLIGGVYDSKKAVYSVIANVTDNYSIRDYYVALNFNEVPTVGEKSLPTRLRVINPVVVDDYGFNSALTMSRDAGGEYKAVLALQGTTEDDVLATTFTPTDNQLMTVAIYARDQSDGNKGYSPTTTAVTDAIAAGDGGFPSIPSENVITVVMGGILSFTSKTDTDEYDITDMVELTAEVVGYSRDAKEAVLGDNPDTEDVTETAFELLAAVDAVSFTKPFKRVEFYAENEDDEELRLIASVSSPLVVSKDVDADADATVGHRDSTDNMVTFVYDRVVSAADLYAALQDSGKGPYDGRIIAIGVSATTEGLDTTGGIGLVSQPQVVEITK